MTTRLRILLPMLCVGVIGVLLFLTGVALAHHSKFMGMHMQLTQNADRARLPENHMNLAWALTPNASVKYFVATPGPHDATPHVTSIAPLMETAVAKWERAFTQNRRVNANDNDNPITLVPVLNWEKADELGDADVRVSYKANCRNARGYFKPPETFDYDGNTPTPDIPAGWHSDTHRRANYWKYADLCIASSSNIPSETDSIRDESLLSIISHEIGHAYGLAEVYDDTNSIGACNNGVESMMDGFRDLRTPTTTPAPYHCDGLTGPSNRDIDLVKEAFATGGIVHLTPTNKSGEATFRWLDNAWGEVRHDIHIYYYDGDRHDSKKDWIKIDEYSYSHTANIGGHKDMPTPVVAPVILESTPVPLTKHQQDNPDEIFSDPYSDANTYPDANPHADTKRSPRAEPSSHGPHGYADGQHL